MMGTMELSKQSKSQVYDEIRGLWTTLTPEEKVRQRLLKKMIGELSYPRELLSVEKSLEELTVFPKTEGSIPLRRVDITCFAKNIHSDYTLYPLLLIECKKEEDSIQKAWEQVKGYNHFLRAYFLAISHNEGELFGYYSGNSFQSLPYLPSYSELIKVVKHVKCLS